MSNPRAVIYVRVSTAEQVKNTSLASQEQSCREYCRRNGLTVDRVFVEDGASAKTAVRAELQSLIEHCAVNAKTLNFLIVWRVDRLARRVYDHHAIRATLVQFGIKLRAVEETFDDTAAGQFMETVMAAAAQLDNDVRADRTSRGMKNALAQGRWMWKAPLGYVKPSSGETTTSMVPDPETAHLVVYAFDQLANGNLTKREVLDEITALGLSRKGRPLSNQSFNNLLRNPIYKGRVVSKGFDFEGPGDFEPLIETRTFDLVQKIGYKRSPGASRRQKNHPDFPLRRFLRCEECGSPLTGSWSKGRSGRYGYYRCYEKTCGKVKGPRDKIHESFEEVLFDMTARKHMGTVLTEVVRDVWAEMRQQTMTRSEAIHSKVADVERKQTKLMHAFVYQGSIDEPTYTVERDRLEHQLTRLKTSKPAEEMSEERLGNALRFAGELLGDLSGYWNQLNPQQRPAFLEAVFPNGLTYGAAGIGTGHSPWFFYGKSLPDTVEEALVAPMGFEPTLPP